MARVRLVVTQEDIEKAHEESSLYNYRSHRTTCCPIAQALSRQLGGRWFVSGIITRIREDTEPFRSFKLTKRAARYIFRADRTRDQVKPTVLMLEEIK